MDAFFFLALVAGAAVCGLAGIAFACYRVRSGAEPTLRSVIARDGGSGEEQ
jgi:xanthosine utilization system XapX-like protein